MDLELYKKVKKEKKMTIADIATAANLPKGTVQNIFCGYIPNPRIDTIEAIERALGIDKQPAAPISNEITEERLQALGFDLTAISDLSDEDLQLIRSTLKTLVTELKERKKK